MHYLCSFAKQNFVATPTGILPLVLSSDVSPAGNHTLRIVTNTSAEGTVVYTIRDTAEPTGEFESYAL